MTKLPTYCFSHKCDFVADSGPDKVRCLFGGEYVYLVDGQLADKPYEPPAPNPKVDRKKQAQHDAQVIGEEQDKERSLLPGSFPRWLHGPRLEIDEHGHLKTPKPQSSVFVLPNSSDDISRSDTEAEKDWQEKHSPIDTLRRFVPKTNWKTPCPKCGQSWNHSPGECQNPEHFERYQAHLKSNRENRRV